ncbi:unnamed protein product [Mortierella alpina]
MAPTPIDPSAMYSGSLLSLIVLILDLMAIIQVLNSDRAVLSKLLWCLLIFLCPLSASSSTICLPTAKGTVSAT